MGYRSEKRRETISHSFSDGKIVWRLHCCQGGCTSSLQGEPSMRLRRLEDKARHLDWGREIVEERDYVLDAEGYATQKLVAKTGGYICPGCLRLEREWGLRKPIEISQGEPAEKRALHPGDGLQIEPVVETDWPVETPTTPKRRGQTTHQERFALYEQKLSDGQIAERLKRPVGARTIALWRCRHHLPANYARGRPREKS